MNQRTIPVTTWAKDIGAGIGLMIFITACMCGLGPAADIFWAVMAP